MALFDEDQRAKTAAHNRAASALASSTAGPGETLTLVGSGSASCANQQDAVDLNSTLSLAELSGSSSLGKFRLDKLVGSGAFGEVYRAYDTELDRHVGPEIPGRHTDLRGHVEHAKDRAALVAAGDHQRTVDARQRVVDDRHDKCLPASGNIGNVKLLVAHELIDKRTFAERTNENDFFSGRCVAGNNLRSKPRDALDVILEMSGDARNARIVR